MRSILVLSFLLAFAAPVHATTLATPVAVPVLMDAGVAPDASVATAAPALPDPVADPVELHEAPSRDSGFTMAR